MFFLDFIDITTSFNNKVNRIECVADLSHTQMTFEFMSSKDLSEKTKINRNQKLNQKLS